MLTILDSRVLLASIWCSSLSAVAAWSAVSVAKSFSNSDILLFILSASSMRSALFRSHAALSPARTSVSLLRAPPTAVRSSTFFSRPDIVSPCSIRTLFSKPRSSLSDLSSPSSRTTVDLSPSRSLVTVRSCVLSRVTSAAQTSAFLSRSSRLTDDASHVCLAASNSVLYLTSAFVCSRNSAWVVR